MNVPLVQKRVFYALVQKKETQLTFCIGVRKSDFDNILYIFKIEFDILKSKQITVY